MALSPMPAPTALRRVVCILLELLVPCSPHGQLALRVQIHGLSIYYSFRLMF